MTGHHKGQSKKRKRRHTLVPTVLVDDAPLRPAGPAGFQLISELPLDLLAYALQFVAVKHMAKLALLNENSARTLDELIMSEPTWQRRGHEGAFVAIEQSDAQLLLGAAVIRKGPLEQMKLFDYLLEQPWFDPGRWYGPELPFSQHQLVPWSNGGVFCARAASRGLKRKQWDLPLKKMMLERFVGPLEGTRARADVTRASTFAQQVAACFREGDFRRRVDGKFGQRDRSHSLQLDGRLACFFAQYVPDTFWEGKTAFLHGREVHGCWNLRSLFVLSLFSDRREYGFGLGQMQLVEEGALACGEALAAFDVHDVCIMADHFCEWEAATSAPPGADPTDAKLSVHLTIRIVRAWLRTLCKDKKRSFSAEQRNSLFVLVGALYARCSGTSPIVNSNTRRQYEWLGKEFATAMQNPSTAEAIELARLQWPLPLPVPPAPPAPPVPAAPAPPATPVAPPAPPVPPVPAALAAPAMPVTPPAPAMPVAPLAPVMPVMLVVPTAPPALPAVPAA
eukprot:CAMPEP_0119354248 /NCGR_PEP_ID=MMETSP1334-20130426/3259_1 /TAXON_ID=127549 /ORGANISM="Calcidiscus leptoporus, Strain RCC1130" /LENGTH=506 /DNA_ID=CAMNT_0007367749 /DNA_START=60 /DNA_END=1580 /DNA_ORIENTATION=+